MSEGLDERAVAVLTRMLESRRTLRALAGDRYADKVGPMVRLIRAKASADGTADGSSVLEAVTDLCAQSVANGHPGHVMGWLAAGVEIIATPSPDVAAWLEANP